VRDRAVAGIQRNMAVAYANIAAMVAPGARAPGENAEPAPPETSLSQHLPHQVSMTSIKTQTSAWLGSDASAGPPFNSTCQRDRVVRSSTEKVL
jgi:hypothetical protein